MKKNTTRNRSVKAQKIRNKYKSIHSSFVDTHTHIYTYMSLLFWCFSSGLLWKAKQIQRRRSAPLFVWLGCPLTSVAEEENETKRFSLKRKVLVWAESPSPWGKSWPHAYSSVRLEDVLSYRTPWFLMYKQWERVLKLMYLEVEESEYLNISFNSNSIFATGLCNQHV